MTLFDLVGDPMIFEAPYNVVTFEGTKKRFLFSNFISDTIPEELADKTVKHITIQDGFIEIEI